MTKIVNFPPKKKINILILPTCNEPGLEVFHSLIKSNKINVFCGSSKPYCKYDSTRIINKDKYFKLPLFEDSKFIGFLKKISIKYQLDYIFPTTDNLVLKLSAENFGKTKVICTDQKTAKICFSKIETYKILSKYLPVPEIYEKENKLEFPLYGKPDMGAGSKNHIIIDNLESLALAQKNKLIVMEYLPGQEYTVDCLSDLKGKLILHNIRIRGSISRGISLGTQNTKNKLISSYIKIISKKLKIQGPWFAQFKLDKKNNPKLLEVNARVGGSSTHTRLSGTNIPLMSVFMFSGYKVKKPNFSFKQITNTRFLTNVTEIPNFNFTTVIWDLDDTIINYANNFDHEAISLIAKFYNEDIKQIILTKNKNVKKIIGKLFNLKIFEKIIIVQEKEIFFHKLIKDQEKTLIINDSFNENYQLSKKISKIKIITPDRLETLTNYND